MAQIFNGLVIVVAYALILAYPTGLIVWVILNSTARRVKEPFPGTFSLIAMGFMVHVLLVVVLMILFYIGQIAQIYTGG